MKMEVLTPAAEKFSLPLSSDEDEEMILNKKKKKKMKLSSGNRISDDDSDNEVKQVSSKAGEQVDSDVENKSPVRRKKKSRIVELEDPSSDEDMSNVKEDEKASQNSNENEGAAVENDEETVKSEKMEKDEKEGDDIGEKSDDDSAKSDNDESADSSDDDTPPLRLFRSKNPATTVTESRGLSTEDADDLYDDERDEEVMPDPTEIAEPRPGHGLGRKASRRPTMTELHSETQRLVRESSVNLPYHRPEPKRLSDFMKRPTTAVDAKRADSKRTTQTPAADDVSANVIDDLPDIGGSSAQGSSHISNSETQGEETNNENEEIKDTDNEPVQNKDCDKISVTQETSEVEGKSTIKEKVSEKTPSRPLTRREKLLQQLPQLPQLNIKKTLKSPSKFIDLDEEPSAPKQSPGVTSLLERFMKHSTAGRNRNAKTPKKVEINIIRKQERPDGSGVELVPDVVKTTTGDIADDQEDDIKAVKNIDTAGTPGQRLQLLRQRLALKMKKRREIERKKKEEIQKLDNEEIDALESEEECDFSEGESEDYDEAEQDEGEPIKKEERRVNGLIDDDSDEDSDQDDTEPFEGNAKSISSLPHGNSHDTSLPRVVNEGSVMLFDESTRSSASTLNKSNAFDGRTTPALDRTCSDDSFYSSLIPLHQPEVSNVSANSQYSKPQLTKKGEFDDTYFESDSRSLSQPFRLDFEASQSQLLDADGFIREASITKGNSKRDEPLLPPGAEDDNAMTDCNMSQLLDLCSAPFDNSLTPVKSKNAEEGLFETSLTPLKKVDDCDVTEENSVSCEMKDKYDDITKDETGPSCDITKEDDNSGDMFRNDMENVDESFGFNILPAEPKKDEDASLKFSDVEKSDDDGEEPMMIVRKKRFTREKIAREFLENEAELSGSEEGSDDEEEVGPDEYEDEEVVEDLPKEEEIMRQVNRVHMRQVMEEDQRDIELLQEAFMGGEEIGQRERKFRWKNIDSSLTEDMLKSDDEEAENVEEPVVIEDSQWMKERLEREEFLRKNVEQVVCGDSEDSQLLKLGRQVIFSRQNSCSASLDANDSKDKQLQPMMLRTGRLSVDESSCSRDSFKNKGQKGSFLSRSSNVLSRLASLQELKNVNGPRNTDKMLFKAVSPKSDKRKRKQLSEINSNSTSREPPRKRTKVVNINEDSNSVFDLF